MQPEYILLLSNLLATLDNVGGKGMSLAKMIQAGFPVPDGFHVTTNAYRAFVDSNNLQTKILSALKDADSSLPTILEVVSAAIRGFLANASIPADITSAITTAYSSLATRPPSPVAVRSSATAEDLPEASCAGQQETSLNIRGEAALAEIGLGHPMLRRILHELGSRFVKAGVIKNPVTFTYWRKVKLTPWLGARD